MKAADQAKATKNCLIFPYFLLITNIFQTQKQLKKQARREQVASQAAQHNADVAKVCQVLELQSLMDNLSEDVRADFLNGTNGAVVSNGTVPSVIK